MANKRTKVPRASLSVTMLDDVELIALAQSPEGRDAALLFIMLILVAKDQDNAGTFTQPPEVLAMLVRWPLAAFKRALEILLESPGRWIVEQDGALTIRSFDKWNRGWGGARENAGRPPKKQTKNDGKKEIKSNQGAQLGSTPASASVAVTASTEKPAAGADFRADFLSRYPECPNKRSQPVKAERAWYRLTDDERAAALKAIEAYTAAVEKWPKAEKKFIPGPLAWIEGRRWEEDVEHWRHNGDGGREKVSAQYRRTDDDYFKQD